MRPRRRWVRITAVVVGIPVVLLFLTSVYFWISYGRLIDAKLGGEQRPMPRIFGRPFEIRPGRGLKLEQLRQRLNDVGYAEREKPTKPGEFSVAGGSVVLAPRTADTERLRLIRVDVSGGAASVVTRLSEVGGKDVDRVTLEAPLLAALAPGQRRRHVPLATIPKVVVQAVLAIEDRRFYDHPGIDPIRLVGAMWTNVFGNKPYLEGASTVTQQIVKNTFLTPEQTLRRKVQEQFMALVLESRFTKDQILELYLNDVVLGQRGPFEIHGVAEASRIFFGKDVSNLTLVEAATIAGIIQSPSRLSPFRNADRAKERRNVVLREMVSAGYIDDETADEGRPPSRLRVQTRALENEAPYFIDYVSNLVEEKYAGLLKKETAVDVYTTLDLQLQRVAQEAVGHRHGASRQTTRAPQAGARPGGARRRRSADGRDSGARRRARLFANPVQPRRDDAAPAGIDLQALRVSGRVRAHGRGGPRRHHAGHRSSSTSRPPSRTARTTTRPATTRTNTTARSPLRRALALSRNIVAIKVAEATGYDRVADLWKQVGVGTPGPCLPVDRARRVRGVAARHGDGLHALSRTAAPSGRCRP